MSILWRAMKKRGFTLVELLVVIAIIGILVAIVLPALSNALLRAKLATASSNARSVVQVFYGRETELIYSATATAWPKYGTTTAPTANVFKTSSTFFQYMMTNGIMEVNPSFFAASGVEPAKDPKQFLATNNAWCIVGDISDAYPETSPAVFTKNLTISTMGETLAGDSQRKGVVDKLMRTDPFQDKGFAFATKGSSSFLLMKDDLRITQFTNLFMRGDSNGQTLTNTVLRP